MTNADKIRSMTDEELALFLFHVWASFIDIKSPYNSADWAIWLKQEVEE